MNNKRVLEIVESKELFFIFLTALGYLISYTYTKGYLEYFDIPANFIEITVAGLVASIGITLYTAYIIVDFVLKYKNFEVNNRDRRVILYVTRALTALAIIIFLLSIFNLWDWRVGLLLVGSIAASIAGILFVEIVRNRSVKRGVLVLLNKAEPTAAAQQKLAKAETTTINDILPLRLGLYFAATLASFALAYAVGRGAAAIQRDFPVLTDSSNLKSLVITMNGT